MSQIAESGTLGQTSPETPQDGGGGRDDSIPRRQEALSPCGHRPGRRGHNAGDEDQCKKLAEEAKTFRQPKPSASKNRLSRFRYQNKRQFP